MVEIRSVDAAIAALDVGVTTSAKASGMAQLTPIHRQGVQSMPTTAEPEIRVLQAVLLPGDRTPTHTHRHPVTLYMLEGEFTLEFEGLPTAVVKAGDVFVEPPHVVMTGHNYRGDVPARMVIFYACAVDEPFADPA